MNDSKPTMASAGKQNPVNPQWHHEFEVLCSLYPSGELTEEEWALLQIHLAYCESCTALFEQFQYLERDVMPALVAESSLRSHGEPRTQDLAAAEDRLMRALPSIAAVPLSLDNAKRTKSWRPYLLLVAACAAGVAAPFAFRWGGLFHPSTDVSKATPASVAVTAAPVQSAPINTTESPHEVPSSANEEIAQLKSQLLSTETHWKEATATATDAQTQLASEQAARAKLTSDLEAANQELEAARLEARNLRDSSATSTVAANQQMQRIASLETRLRELNSSVEEKDRMLALDKEFLSHDREIRDLIAARNLYIADIYDVAQDGQTAKPFGRIFYTKDRSLVFYGYDLDKQKGLKQSVAFQAWGSGDDKKDVSLGLFYQDETHKRWVLQFNDTKTLSRLNMVFVTAEPRGGSVKPTGKPVLLAYLQVQPNHP